MPNEEIIGGLRLALIKKEPLQKAMITFYNAGYTKEDIEEAARIVHQEQSNFQSPMVQEPTKQKEQMAEPGLTKQIKSPFKKVSDYSSQNFKSSWFQRNSKWLLEFLIAIALTVIGITLYLLIR